MNGKSIIPSVDAEEGATPIDEWPDEWTEAVRRSKEALRKQIEDAFLREPST